MKKLFNILICGLFFLTFASCGNYSKDNFEITESSALYNYNGYVVNAKTKSINSLGDEFYLELKFEDDRQKVLVTKKEFSMLNLRDTIKVYNKQGFIVKPDTSSFFQYKIVKIGNYDYIITKGGGICKFEG